MTADVLARLDVLAEGRLRLRVVAPGGVVDDGRHLARLGLCAGLCGGACGLRLLGRVEQLG